MAINSRTLRNAAEIVEAEMAAAKARRKARQANPNAPKTYERRCGMKLLEEMIPGRDYPNKELRAIAVAKGERWSCVGPATSQMIKDGKMKRTETGTYRKI